MDVGILDLPQIGVQRMARNVDLASQKGENGVGLLHPMAPSRTSNLPAEES